MNKREWLLKRSAKRPYRAWIWNENYKQGCYILWPVDSDQLKAEFMNIFPKAKLEDGAFAMKHAKFIAFNNMHCIAFKTARPEPGVIAHECLHFCNYLFEGLGIKMDEKNDEPQAYFLWWAVDKIYNLTRGLK